MVIYILGALEHLSSSSSQSYTVAPLFSSETCGMMDGVCFLYGYYFILQETERQV